jgi:Tfp pilus assembly protein PilN
MVDKWIKKIVRISKVAAISIKLLPENASQVSLCILEKKKSVITIAKTVDDIALEDVTSLITVDIPVVLVLDGRGVLHKKLDADMVSAPGKLLTKIIPQATPNDFYLQQFESGSVVFASLIRQQLLNDIIGKLTNLKLDVVKVYQGPFVTAVLLPFLDLTQMIVDKDKLTITDGVITDYHASSPDAQILSYKVGDEEISSTQLLPYAAALSCIVGQEPQQAAGVVAGISDLQSNWEQKQLFKKAGIGVLATIFAILLINAFLFVVFDKRNRDLSEKVSEGHSTIKELSRLKETVKTHKVFVEMAGWDRKTPVWFFADRLAASMVDGIYLTDLYIHPMDERRAKDERKIIFGYATVSVTGVCQSPVILNEWLRKLKEISWIESVNKQAYHFNDKEKTGTFSFELVTSND